MFNVGDKVRIISSERYTYWYADRIGEVFTLICCDPFDSCWRVKESDGWVDHSDIELVSEFDLKKNPWFIRTGTKEKSEATQKWLFEQGLTWNDGSKCLYNYGEIIIETTENSRFVKGDYPEPESQEIILEFETVVKSVTYPSIETESVKTEQDKKIKELKETIDKAQQQLEEMMGK